MTTTEQPIYCIRRDIAAMQSLIRIMRATGADADEIAEREADLASLYINLNAHPEA